MTSFGETLLKFIKISPKKFPKAKIPPIKPRKFHQSQNNIISITSNPNRNEPIIKGYLDVSQKYSRNKHQILSTSQSSPCLYNPSTSIFQNPALNKVLKNSSCTHIKQLSIINTIQKSKMNQNHKNQLLKKINYNYKLRKRNNETLKLINHQSDITSRSEIVSSPINNQIINYRNYFSFNFGPRNFNVDNNKTNSLKVIQGIYFKGKSLRLRSLIHQRKKNEDTYENISSLKGNTMTCIKK